MYLLSSLFQERNFLHKYQRLDFGVINKNSSCFALRTYTYSQIRKDSRKGRRSYQYGNGALSLGESFLYSHRNSEKNITYFLVPWSKFCNTWIRKEAFEDIFSSFCNEIRFKNANKWLLIVAGRLLIFHKKINMY